MKGYVHPLVIFFWLCLFWICGCGRQNALESFSGTQVTTIEQGEYPAVVEVVLPGGKGICTGTFVSPRTVLTAAHCTQKHGAYRILSSFGNFITIDVLSLGEGESGDPNDLALLILKEDVADPEKGQVIRIGESVTPTEGVRLVGFGCNNLSTKLGAGVKRTGLNKVHAISNHIELMTPLDAVTVASEPRGVLGPGEAAGACFGDSGGPLLRQYGEDRWEIVGVSHAGRWSASVSYSLYTDLGRAENRAFLAEADDGLGLGIFSECAQEGFLARMGCGIKPASMEILAFLKSLWLKLLALF